jgi:hypothetical protein
MGPELYISRFGESGPHVTKALDFSYFRAKPPNCCAAAALTGLALLLTGLAALLAGLDVGPHPRALPVVIRAEFGWQV